MHNFHAEGADAFYESAEKQFQARLQRLKQKRATSTSPDRRKAISNVIRASKRGFRQKMRWLDQRLF